MNLNIKMHLNYHLFPSWQKALSKRQKDIQFLLGKNLLYSIIFWI